MTTTSPYQFTVWFRWSVSSIDVEQSLDWWCNLSKILRSYIAVAITE